MIRNNTCRATAAASWLLLLLLAFAGPGSGAPARGTAHAAPADLAAAQSLIETGSFQEAMVLLNGVVERHPRDADARLLLGTALALVPRRSEALRELREAIRLRPDFAPAHHTLGMVLARFMEPEPARQAFTRAIELDPRFAPAHIGLALVLGRLEQREAALLHLEKAAALLGDLPEAAEAHRLRGILLSEQDELGKAEQALGRAVALEPRDADGFFHLGLVRKRRSDVEGSVAAFREAVRLDAGRAEAQYELGSELLRAGDAAAASEHLQAALRLKPDDAAALYKLARALRAAGKADEAQTVAAKVRQIKEQSLDSQQNSFKGSELNNEGVELEKAGRLDAAIDRYASALELDPLNTVFRRNLAMALCRVGRWAEGVQELREVTRLDPADEEATRALYIALEKVEPPPR